MVSATVAAAPRLPDIESIDWNEDGGRDALGRARLEIGRLTAKAGRWWWAREPRAQLVMLRVRRPEEGGHLHFGPLPTERPRVRPGSTLRLERDQRSHPERFARVTQVIQSRKLARGADRMAGSKSKNRGRTPSGNAGAHRGTNPRQARTDRTRVQSW